MKAIVVTPGTKGSVRLTEMEAPRPAASQALLKVLKLGIDRTDLDINDGFYGQAPPGSEFLVAGHECLAVVEKAPQDCGVVPGDLVVPTVRRPDDCINCRNGESDMCLKGDYREHGIKLLHGFASELAVSDVDYLVKIPEQIREVAVLLEPMSIAEKGFLQSSKIQERMVWGQPRALVLGAGPLGMLTAYLLRMRGLDVHSVATRPHDSPKAKLLERVGATYVDAREQAISELGKFDLIFEETGVSEVAYEGAGLLNTNGVMCLLGIYDDKELSCDLGRLLREVVLGNKVIFGSVNANKRHFQAGAEDFVRINKMYPGALAGLISEILPPEGFLKAYKPTSEDEIKTVLDFESSAS